MLKDFAYELATGIALMSTLFVGLVVIVALTRAASYVIFGRDIFAEERDGERPRD